MANKLGFTVPTETEVLPVSGVELPVVTVNPVFKVRTPLWYYILKASEVTEAGPRLGAVGSRIVAEVFWGLLWADRSSFLNSPLGETWTPTIPNAANSTPVGDFRTVDILAHAGHAAPDGTPT